MRQRLESLWIVVAKAATDALLFALAFLCAYLLRFGGDLPADQAALLRQSLPLVVIVKLAVFALFGNYATLWRYSSISDLLRLVRGAVSATLVLIATWYVIGDRVPSSVAALDLLLTLLFCGLARVAPRLARERVNPAFLAAFPVYLRRLIAPRARGRSAGS